jgi:hypothetical protein
VLHIGRCEDMLVCMRTTLNLPDALVEAAKAKASAEGRTLTSVVEEGLRAVLTIPEPRAAPVSLPAFGEHGQQFLVDLDDRDAVWAALDSDAPGDPTVTPR